MPIDPGATFGRYVVHELLGRGGMGEVYRAFDPRLERQVALKILSARADGTPELSKKGERSILREARVAAALDHPNVVAVFDLGEHQGAPFLAMELVRGRSLRALVGQPGLSVEQRVRFLTDVARALAAAHRAGIVHRDVKPENVMVREDGVVKVLDFGIARAPPARETDVTSTSETETLATLTAGGALVGTPPYMAPEQVRRRQVDGRADQFAWGVLGYELLSGKLPWTRTDSLFDVVSSVLHETPRRLREAVPEVPEAVDAVVMRALAKDPGDRFASMGEAVRALVACYGWSTNDVPLPAVDPGWAGPDEATLTAAGLKETAADTWSRSGAVAAVPIVPKAREGDPRDARPAAPAAPATSPARRPSLPRWTWALVAAIAIAAFALSPSRPSSPPPASSPATGVGLTDLPAPVGCNAAALAEHKRGMSAMRDGSWEQAHASFERAVSADPECAAAAMRLSMTGLYRYPIARTRDVYRRAMGLRDKLDRRDQLLLDAYELLIRRDPSDVGAFEDRARALAAEYPGDAELAAIAATRAPEPKERIARARQALAIDPRYADAMQLLGEALNQEGELEEALSTLADCVRVAPNSIDCIDERVAMLRYQGRCAEAEADTRLWIARDPDTATGYAVLAAVLAAQGGSKVAVDEALQQRWSRLAEPERSRRRLYEQALADVLGGDLAAAEQHAGALTQLLSGDSSLAPQVRASLLRVEILEETGRGDAAAAVAGELFEREGAWSSAGLVEQPGLGPKIRLVEPRILSAARHGGRLPEAAWRAARDRIAAAMRREGYFDASAIGLVEHVLLAETPAEAALALRDAPALRSTDAGPASRPREISDAFLGPALRAAGRPADAVRVLREVVVPCSLLDDPFLHTRAELWLGQALEDTGDKPAACAAYRVVLDRWGGASPRSVTADTAARRVAALQCPR